MRLLINTTWRRHIAWITTLTTEGLGRISMVKMWGRRVRARTSRRLSWRWRSVVRSRHAKRRSVSVGRNDYLIYWNTLHQSACLSLLPGCLVWPVHHYFALLDIHALLHHGRLTEAIIVQLFVIYLCLLLVFAKEGRVIDRIDEFYLIV